MENEIKKKLNKIEKICLAGAIIGTSLIAYGIISDRQNIMNYGAILNTPCFITYFLSSRKNKELEKEKNYYYKN